MGGGRVITNLLSFICSLVIWLSGDFIISGSSLLRFFIIHFIISIIVLIFIVIHIFYLHKVSGHNFLGINVNCKLLLYKFIVLKDIYFLYVLNIIILLEIYLGYIVLSHSDNVFQVCILVTPLHIVPEWYFLLFYTILKIIPNKIIGFLIMMSLILYLFNLGEFKGVCNYVLNIIFVVIYKLYLVLIIILYLFWVGVQLPQELLLIYCRVLLCIFCYILY